jgi:hypothetical protein
MTSWQHVYEIRPRKEGRQEVRGEEGETKEVTLATTFWFLLG